MKRTLLLIPVLFICIFTYAQETITVTSVVTDGTNQPMPAAKRSSINGGGNDTRFNIF